ncbi:MAG TPA: glycoside-pentoside-hexuronide (GPH):cation symporter [Clostridia bacterium]|nr:glycoside-pentoside-hexuronide (GPH):cation symporter [Clostridia bacterium]
MTQIQNTVAEPIDKRSKWSYCFGGVGRDMSYQLFNGWLFTFILLTNKITLQQQLTLTALFIAAKIWDGVNDPIMGFIIERTRTRFGKFKPWILIGVLTNSAVLMVIYTSSMYGLTGWSYVAFIACMYLLWDFTYTMNDIGYWSMLPALTSNDNDRNSLTSWANLLAGAGGGAASIAIPFFTAGEFTIGGSNIIAFAVIAAIICLFFIGCQLLTFFGVKEKNLAVKGIDDEEKMSLRKVVNIIKSNDQLRWTAIVMLIYNTASGVLSSFMTIYVYITYGYEGSLVTIFTVVYGIMGAVPMLLFPYLSRTWGRRKMIWICILTAIAGYALFFLMGFISGTKGFYLLAACGVLINFGQVLFYNILTINISNSVEYNEWKFGTRNEGIIFSLRPLMAKFGSALQFGILSVTYAALNITKVTNYISEVENGVFQGIYQESEKATLIAAELKTVDPSVMLSLRCVMVFLPIVFLLLAVFVCSKKCTIDEKKYNQIVRELAERKQAAESQE